jgi:hypothetical protein
MIKIFLISILLITLQSYSQELFVVTEPASNMPSKSIGIRMGNYLMQTDSNKKTSYHLMPEIMVSVTNKLMVHMALITSNRKLSLDAEGVSFYAKYRFLSIDNVHRHLRMAGFGRYSYNTSPIHMLENSLLMHNSGYEYGAVATQLLHKTAISSTISLQRAISTKKSHYHYTGLNNSLNYSLSFGQLLLPQKYKSYKQANVNAMIEFIGQHNLVKNKGFIDIVPSVQCILNSVARIDIGYRTNLKNDLLRTYSKGILIKFEYNFFNAFK